MTVERQLIEDRKQKAIRQAEEQYLRDYNRIGKQSQDELAKAHAEAKLALDSGKTEGQLKMPDLQQILLDQNRLADMQRQLIEKKQANQRLVGKNDVITK